MRARDERRTSPAWLVVMLLGAACTATVDDDPFSTVGMSGATMATSVGTNPTSAGADGSGGSDTAGTDDGATTDSGSDDAADSTDGGSTTGDECSPPCDPMTSMCEQGECVPSGPPDPGQLVISELMINPAMVTDDEGEWIELTNVSPGPVNLEGCVLYDSGSDEDVIDSGAPIIIPAGGTAVVGKEVEMGVNGGVPGVVYGFGTSFSLANTGDEVRLECGGMVIDEVAYDDTWPFDDGVAMQLSSAMLDVTANDDPLNWCAATAAYGFGDLGTPAAANDGC